MPILELELESMYTFISHIGIEMEINQGYFHRNQNLSTNTLAQIGIGIK